MLEVENMHPSSLVGRSHFFKEYQNIILMWSTPKLFKRPKGGSQSETTEEKRVGARSLACNISGLGRHVGALGRD
jgi:hypothetical protein